MRKTQSTRRKNPRGLFLPSGSTRWHFQFQCRGQRCTESTGETDRAKAEQLAAAERERIIKQLDAEREAGRRPMTVADAFRQDQEGVTIGTPTEATALLGSNKSVGELTQSDITDIRSARRTMTTTRGAGRDDQGGRCERWWRPRRSIAHCNGYGPRFITCEIITRHSCGRSSFL
jgi:hypothetical protein